MSIRLNWLTVSNIKVTLADRGEEMGDGNCVTSPVALVIDEGDEPILIEGKRSSLAAAFKPAMLELEVYRHADLTNLVHRAHNAAELGSNDVEIKRLKEALDVALTILGREDLR